MATADVASATGWFWIGAVAAVVSLAAWVAAVRYVRHWPEMGTRYDRPRRAVRGRSLEGAGPGTRPDVLDSDHASDSDDHRGARMSANHGNTPAAWTAVVVGLVGFVVGGVGLMLDPVNMTVFWVGVAITVAAAVVFVVMGKLGLHGPLTD